MFFHQIGHALADTRNISNDTVKLTKHKRCMCYVAWYVWNANQCGIRIKTIPAPKYRIAGWFGHQEENRSAIILHK
jgi:hypothetical protein